MFAVRLQSLWPRRSCVTFSRRKYAITTPPDGFSGLPFLQTRQADKVRCDDEYRIRVRLAEDCLVFLAVDRRTANTFRRKVPPQWLRGFERTQHSIVTDDPFMVSANTGFTVFVRNASAGEFVFGPPCFHGNTNSMYFAFFGKLRDMPADVTPTSGAPLSAPEEVRTFLPDSSGLNESSLPDDSTDAGDSE